MNPSIDPKKLDIARPEEARDRSEGLSAIIAVVAVAGVIIAALLYIIQPPLETPKRVSSEAPSATSPPATPKTNTGQ